jgi:hypothetical protein
LNHKVSIILDGRTKSANVYFLPLGDEETGLVLINVAA